MCQLRLVAASLPQPAATCPLLGLLAPPPFLSHCSCVPRVNQALASSSCPSCWASSPRVWHRKPLPGSTACQPSSAQHQHKRMQRRHARYKLHVQAADQHTPCRRGAAKQLNTDLSITDTYGALAHGCPSQAAWAARLPP